MSRTDEPDAEREPSLSRFSVSETPPSARGRPNPVQLTPRAPGGRGTRDRAPSRLAHSPALLGNLLARATTTLDVQIMNLLAQSADKCAFEEFAFPVRLLVARKKSLMRCFADAPTDPVLREAFVAAAESATELAADVAAGGPRRAKQLNNFVRELNSELMLRKAKGPTAARERLLAQQEALVRAEDLRLGPMDRATLSEICQLGLQLTRELATPAAQEQSSWLDVCLAELEARD